MLFIELEPLCQKLWAFLSNFGSFYNARSPNMVMSRDPRCKLLNFFLVLILHLILGKVTRFLLEKLSTSEVISKKPHPGGGDGTPPVPLGLKSAVS